MKLIVVSNGTKEGTFVRNADTGEALEGVEHIAFNFDGEKCVTTVMLTTGLVVNGQIQSRNVQDSFMSPGGFTPKPMTGFTVPKAPDTSKGLPEDDGFLDPAAALNNLPPAMDDVVRTAVLKVGTVGKMEWVEACPICHFILPAHAHHCEEGGVRLSTKHIPRSPADIATELEKDPGNESLRKELGDAVAPTPPFPGQCTSTTLDAFGFECRCVGDCDHLYEHWSGPTTRVPLRWDDKNSASKTLPKPDPFAHCTYCKLYYCDASSDHSCMEASDHQHKWVPPFTAFKPPPVLPTRIEKQEAPVGYLGLVERAPHYDAFVLHLKRDCRTCAMPEFEPLHVWRKEHRVNHTGEYDPLKAICPAELRRSKEGV